MIINCSIVISIKAYDRAKSEMILNVSDPKRIMFGGGDFSDWLMTDSNNDEFYDLDRQTWVLRHKR